MIARLLRACLSPCVFVGHEEPIKVVRGKVLSFECPRCLAVIRKPLPKQKFKARADVPKAKVLRLAKRKAG